MTNNIWPSDNSFNDFLRYDPRSGLDSRMPYGRSFRDRSSAGKDSGKPFRIKRPAFLSKALSRALVLEKIASFVATIFFIEYVVKLSINELLI